MRLNKKSQNRKKIFWAISALIILIGAWTAYALYNSQNLKISSQENVDKSNPIDPKVEERVKGGAGSGQGEESAASGGVVDTGGKNVTPQSDGTTSQSGNITLYSPTSNEIISSSVTVEGSAKTSMVYYRINDNVRGMIGSGQLSVHNGNFSGNLSVSTTATQGSIEVYSLDSQGREINNISVNVKYS